MSSGKQHDLATVTLSIPLPIVIGGIVSSFSDISYGIVCAFFVFLGIQFQRLLTPDTDIDGKSYQDYLMFKINKPIGYFWYIFWIPYGKLVRHRSFISHSPIISTLIRIIYLISPLLILSIKFEFARNILICLIFYYWDLTIFFILGMIIGDLGHLLLDYNMFVRTIADKFLGKGEK